MIVRTLPALLCTLACATTLMYAQNSTSTRHTKTPSIAPSPNSLGVSSYTQDNVGERIFQQQCSRCHSVPESFSPRISGTVVRHMRVRASLSRQDEQDLLRFFNP
jgi:cytochrome c5